MPSDPFLPPGSEPTPIPPGAESAPSLTTDSAQTTSLGLPPNVAAGLSVVGILVTGVLFFVLEKRNQFVRFWAMQAIFFGVAWVVVMIVATVIGTILGPIPLIGRLWGLVAWLVYVGFAVVWLFMLFQAFIGKAWEVPALGKMARAQLSRTPSS